jgi:hypothetical protein
VELEWTTRELDISFFFHIRGIPRQPIIRFMYQEMSISVTRLDISTHRKSRAE